MIAHLSIGGSGSFETLEQAAVRAIESATPLLSVAIVEDARFADVDSTTMAMLVEEVEFLLRAQMVVLDRHIAGELETSVSVVRGELLDVIASIPAGVYLIGGPTVPGTDDLESLVRAMQQRTGRPVELLS